MKRNDDLIEGSMGLALEDCSSILRKDLLFLIDLIF